MGPGGRTEARIREISLQSMVEATSLKRIARAASTKTTQPGDHLYQPGDLDDYCRDPPNKDLSGWHGPARVICNELAEGKVVVKSLGKEMSVEYRSARLALNLFSFSPESHVILFRHSSLYCMLDHRLL